MPPTLPWRPMRTAPQRAARIWLNHLTLGPILAEARPGRWYAPSAADQVWRWYRPAEPDALEPFSGWLPFEASEADGALSASAVAKSGGAGAAAGPGGARRMPVTAGTSSLSP